MTITFKDLCPAALAILSAFLCVPSARAAGVVSVCDESHLLAAVRGGGLVTFGCTGVITFADLEIHEGTAVIIDGGGTAILSGPISLICSAPFGCRLDLLNITMQSSPTGAIFNQGNEVHISNTTFARNGTNISGGIKGGAIYNNMGGLLYVNDCYFLLNGAGKGGAIYNQNGAFTVSDSTFFLNSAADAGGAIYNTGGSMFISNSTFTDNGSFSGNVGNIYFDHGDGLSEIRNSTLSGGRASPGNFGNLYAASASQTPELIVVNTIIANPAGPYNCVGALIDGGGNLNWPPSSFPCVGAVADPKLGPLVNNGRTTLTMALMPGSAAINKGSDPQCTATDQRHVLRPQGPHCDIGAYEDIPTMIQFIEGLGRDFGNFEPLVPGTGAGTLTQRVISPLSRSLDATLWQADGNHLNPQRGEQVFDLHQTIVNNLAELIVDQTQLDYIGNLLFVDRALVVAAMSAANCGAVGAASPANSKCGQATSELAKGDSSSAAGNYGDAINHYKSAWSDVASPSSHD